MLKLHKIMLIWYGRYDHNHAVNGKKMNDFNKSNETIFREQQKYKPHCNEIMCKGPAIHICVCVSVIHMHFKFNIF